MSAPVLLVRLVRGRTGSEHVEKTVALTRVPCRGELVQFGDTTEPCRVLEVLHHALPVCPPGSAVVASLEVE